MNTFPKGDSLEEMIASVNNAFYNGSGASFDKIPFDSLLPDLLLKYGIGREILEIGSGPGAFASWLVERGYQSAASNLLKNLPNKQKARD